MVGIIPGGFSGESKVVQMSCSRKGARERERGVARIGEMVGDLILLLISSQTC